MSKTRQEYQMLCESTDNIPIFSQWWWLDAAAGADNWSVVLVKRGGKIVASMPYVLKKEFGFTTLRQPQLTQTLGPWFAPIEGNYAKKLSKQKQYMFELIDQLPKFKHFKQAWHYSQTNWLPFYWRGFSQTTHYTYVIHDLSDLSKVFADFSHAKRKNIRKAEKEVTVYWDMSKEDMYENHQYTLGKQGDSVSYPKETFFRLYDAVYSREQGRTIWAGDSNGNIHAVLFVIWDQMSAYDLISSIDPDFRNSGAASLLVKEIIQYIKEAEKSQKFDFEGSMIESVENSFRQFGAVQTSYFKIQKTPSNLLRILKMAEAVKNKII